MPSPQENSTTARAPVKWLTPIQFVPGVGVDRAELFAKLGVRTAGQALFFFPRDYEQPASATLITQLKDGVAASLIGQITEVEIAGGRSTGRSILGVLVENDHGAIRLLFFNQPFRAETLRRGTRVLVSGVPRLNGFRFEFVHPKVTVIEAGESIPEDQILAIYPLVEGLKQSHVRRALATVTDDLASSMEEALSDEIRLDAASRLDGVLPAVATPLMGIHDAIAQLHRPTSQSQLDAARRRLIFQELFVLQLALAMRRRHLTTELTAPPLETSTKIDSRIKNRFGFELTDDQANAIAEVGRDMARQFPMNRLIQGDVGSGKTVIAQYAMMLAVANGYQSVMMAPTEVLARQHYQTLQKSLADSRVRLGLLCGSMSAAERRDVLKRTAEGTIDVLVGTQALLYGDISFAKLALCVIDEQHKFGVQQRLALRRGGVDPHCLVLSATPIPRTITMTMFGDLDVSTLKQKPPGRGTLHTYLSEDGWRDRWWKFVSQKLDEGRQAFVVAPRIVAPEIVAPQIPATQNADGEERDGEPVNGERANDEVETVSSVINIYDELRNGPLQDYRVALLHGRMTADEKNDAMQKFFQGRTQVLVSTTVIEVGLDVANATVMTIMGAERFGLAQLHQLRGRVARGKQPGHVCLFTDAKGSPEEIERLNILASTTDGFAIAEADFRLRGPGDLLGKRQSGIPMMRIADFSRDEAILVVARQIAQEVIDADPDLSSPTAKRLRAQVIARYGTVFTLGDVA